MNDDVVVSMFNLVLHFSSTFDGENKTMTEDERMLYDQCCNTLKAQAALDELVIKDSTEKLKSPKPDDPGDTTGKGETAPC